MNIRVFAGVFALLVGISLTAHSADSKETEKVKAALQQVQEFIGDWKGNGGPPTKDPKANELWKETMNWGWRFKGDDIWLNVEFKDSKTFESGALRYMPDKKLYTLTMIDKAKKEQVFQGELKKGILTLTRTDPESMDKQTITMSTNNEGARLVYDYSVQTKGKGLNKKVFTVAHSKEGEMIGGGGKKNECIVTGGLATMAVTYMGETYYVCCTGCRDAFNENPKKFVDAFKAKKK
jgi:YHS domain-containing protein